MTRQNRYTFRPARHSDLPMLARWLTTPEVARWWGDPVEQLALLTADLEEPLMTMLIVETDGMPIAYAQHYDISAWPQEHFGALPKGTRAIDTFIGEQAMIGIGHGSLYLRQLAETLIAGGATAVAIDPDLTNLRALRSYARAGFVETAIVHGDDGDDILMVWQPIPPQ